MSCKNGFEQETVKYYIMSDAGGVLMDTWLNTSDIISALKDKYIKLWENTPDTFPMLREPFSILQQREKDAQMSTFTDEVILLVKGFSDNSSEDSARWGSTLKKLIYGCGTDIIGLDSSSMKLLLEDGFCDVTSDFITEAREFDENFKMDEIFQALRNVWIMNCIQKLMGFKVITTPSMFAYSMLYPYTDNYLDAAAVSAEKKRHVNHRFERRLAGELLKADTAYESKLFRLVDIIEGQFSRRQYPMVYMSLLGIHGAQNKSLLQQTNNKAENRLNILDISVEKGGSSVLADACLVKGSLSSEEASFVFGFGVLLQLLDDLQDAALDRSNGHNTIFSTKNAGCSPESCTNKLINFIWKVMDEDACFVSPDAVEIKNMMKKSILFLLLGAVASNRNMYDKNYLKKLEIYSPLSFRYLKSFYRRIGREYGKLKIKLTVKSLEAPMAKAFAAGVM